mgnify:CR=1 FL=1
MDRHRRATGLREPPQRRRRCREWSPLGSPAHGVNPVTWQGTLARTARLEAHPRAPTAVRVRARERPGRRQPGGLGRLHLPPERQHGLDRAGRPGVHLDGLPGPDRSRASHAVRVRLPVPGDYLARRRRHDHRTHAALHLEGAVRREQLLRRRRQGRELQQRHRRGLHADPGLRAAQQPQADDLQRRETTTFYWAVLPSQNAGRNRRARRSTSPNCRQGLVPEAVDAAQPGLAEQRARRSSTSRPSAGRRRSARAATGSRSSADPSFGDPLDDVVTDATSYSSNTTYPADTVLYWRVRADDENLTGLTWSATGTFQKKLATPAPSAANPTAGDMLPVWAWSPDAGRCRRTTSRSTSPTARTRDFDGFRTPVASFIKMTGTGVFHWRVRAELPEGHERRACPGPYSATQSFTRTIGEPGEREDRQRQRDHVLLSWNPRLGVKEYKVQIASSPDFSRRRRGRVDATTRATRRR